MTPTHAMKSVLRPVALLLLWQTNGGCVVYALKVREFPMTVRITGADDRPQQDLRVAATAYVLDASGSWLRVPTREGPSQPAVTDALGQASVVLRETWCDCILAPLGLTIESPRMTGVQITATSPRGESRSFRFERQFDERVSADLGVVRWDGQRGCGSYPTSKRSRDRLEAVHCSLPTAAKRMNRRWRGFTKRVAMARCVPR